MHSLTTEARHSRARHSRARHSRARHSVARHSRARYSRARHSGASVQLVIVNLIQSQPPFSSMGTQVFIVLWWSLECVILTAEVVVPDKLLSKNI